MRFSFLWKAGRRAGQPGGGAAEGCWPGLGRDPRRILVLLLVAAFLLRLAAGWVWQSRLEGRFGFGDSDSYWVLGRSIALGQPYEYGSGVRVFRTPGYPLLLAPLFWLFGPEPPVMWARAESALFGTLAVVAVWGLGRVAFDRRVALAAAGIAAFYPGAVATSALVLSEAAFGPWMVLQLVFWIAAWQAGTFVGACGWAALAGLTAGWAALIRPSWLLFTPFALSVGLVAGPRRRWQLATGAVMLAASALVMLPWWVRNARVTGHFVLATLQVGASLYDGLNPRADGSSDMGFVPRFAEAERREPAGAGGQPSDCFEYRLDRRLRRAAIQWVRSHPGAAVRLAGKKLVRMWNIWPNEPSLSAWPVRLMVAASYLPVVALGLAGAIRTSRRGWPAMLLWLPAVYFSLLHMIFVSSIRYRQPPLLAGFVLAAAAIFWRPRHGAGSSDTAASHC